VNAQQKRDIHKLSQWYSMRVADCGADLLRATNYRKYWCTAITCKPCLAKRPKMVK
jgi:hypothetical protein